MSEDGEEKTYTCAELDAAGLIGPYWCTCLDDFSPYITDSGFCSFCETIEKLGKTQTD
jgi:hypothetical protein